MTINIIKCFFSQRISSFLIQGVISGIPFLVILSTLSVRLTEEGYGMEVVGLLSLTTIPYSCKFLWFRYLDIIYIPYVSSFLGIRRAPLVINQVIISLLLIILGLIKPSDGLFIVLFIASFISFLSANQDLLIDIFRVESIAVDEQHFATSMNVLGYRIGMLLGGGGTLYIAAFHSWSAAYWSVSCISLFLTLLTIFITHPKDLGVISYRKPSNFLSQYSIKRSLLKLSELVSNVVLIRQNRNLLFILLFILLFKFIDTVISFVTNPFLLDIGFDKEQIAKTSGIFGVITMFLGAFLAGLVINIINIKNTIILCLNLQIICALLFFLQNAMGNYYMLLYIVLGVKGIASGMVSVSMLTFIGQICKRVDTTSRMAFLSSYASLSRIFITVIFGWMCNYLDWGALYLFTIALSLPAFLILPLIYLEESNKIIIAK